ncbi:MAG TPA: hypothetical protein VGM53_23880 [Streptosporangiaceae bacterium]|jgi:hypothetical protein
MTALSRTRAVVRDIAQHAPTALVRHRALLFDQLAAGITSTAPSAGMLRQIVIAIRDLAGPAWLAAHASEPAVHAFTRLDTTPTPPPLPVLDHTLARCLQARFTTSSGEMRSGYATALLDGEVPG